MSENPLIPAGPELAWAAMLIAVGVLWVAAAVTLWRRRERLNSAALIAWTVAIVVFPLIGAAAWLLFGVRSRGGWGRQTWAGPRAWCGFRCSAGEARKSGLRSPVRPAENSLGKYPFESPGIRSISTQIQTLVALSFGRAAAALRAIRRLNRPAGANRNVLVPLHTAFHLTSQRPILAQRLVSDLSWVLTGRVLD